MGLLRNSGGLSAYPKDTPPAGSLGVRREGGSAEGWVCSPSRVRTFERLSTHRPCLLTTLPSCCYRLRGDSLYLSCHFLAQRLDVQQREPPLLVEDVSVYHRHCNIFAAGDEGERGIRVGD